MAKQRMGTRERLKVVDQSLQARTRRLRTRAISILQISLAAGVAYWVAQRLLGHEMPFFAPIAVVIILGLSGVDRIKRALDMSLGSILGVLVGDLLSSWLGPGAWQLAIIVAAALTLASFVTNSQLVNNQVAIGGILIATIMPPGAETTGLDRTMDAVVGSAIGLLAVALIPSAPLRRGRKQAGQVLEMASSVLDDISAGLRERNVAKIEEALTAARSSQDSINAMETAARSGMETSRLSPILWGARRHVRHFERAVNPVDNMVRNARVLARRALVLTEDRDQVSTAQLEILDELAAISLALSDVFEGKEEVEEALEIPDLVNRLRILGAKAGMDVVDDKSVLSAYVVLAQSRSIISDLLEVCGMSRESAVAVLAPTSDTPAYPPELWEEE
ncbi:MAG TPA: FUSC family protein [Corynebacterium sp.]|nr:FUSC family protein [Corynebacterium sp.]